MSKFNQAGTRTAVSSPIKTESVPSGRTFEGAPGYARDVKSELFLLAVANMVSEDTFYEDGKTRDERYERLIHEVAVADVEWTSAFLRWLRTEGNMRSASLVGAAEAVRARIAAKAFGANRQLVDSVLRRADEPGEMLAYWRSRHGRSVPLPVKNGVADGAIRLYDERSLLKYDTAAHTFRFADVIDLVRPTPSGQWQSDLFRYALDRRHNRDNPVPDGLSMVRNNAQLRRAAVENPEALLFAENLRAAGMTWEDVLSLVGSKVDKARLWSALIPTMGYMALLRNLRNFDQSGVPDDVAETLAARLADPEQVAKSRQFPFRFLAAYRNAPSLRWGHALDKALTASLANVPALSGQTLILVDLSGSMQDRTGGKLAEMTRADVAKVFGAALALRAEQPTLAWFGTSSGAMQVPRGGSLLKLVEAFPRDAGGTDTVGAIRRHYRQHDRVVIVTDEQATSWGGPAGDQTAVDRAVPAQASLYTWNLAGYRHGHAPSGSGNRHTFGGMGDAGFRMIPLLEAGRNANWPWTTQG